MQQILKRLELIKTAITIEDEEIIILLIDKLSKMDIDFKIKNILKSIEDKDYNKASYKIDIYIEEYSKVGFSNYVVSFVDILGQKNELDKIKDIIPHVGDESFLEGTAEITKIFDNTYEHIRLLRMHFKQEYYNYMNNKRITNTDSQLTFNSLETSVFSDFVMNYMSLKNTEKILPLEGVFFMLVSTGVVFLKLLAKGIKIRGGVDLGIGMKISNNELYGSALLNAYKLECDIAQYPRIVIGNNLIVYLKKIASIVPKTENGKINKEFASKCLKIISNDADGNYKIDYLSDIFKVYYGKDLSATIDLAYETVVEEYEKQISNKNHKLALRYFQIRSYFEDRLKIGKI